MFPGAAPLMAIPLMTTLGVSVAAAIVAKVISINQAVQRATNW